MSCQRSEQACIFNKKGYNCSQTLLCTYADVIGLDHIMAYRIAEGFGGGMGRMRETCGVLTGMYMVVSYIMSDGILDHGKSKLETYAQIRHVHDEFVKRLGSSICRVLLTDKKITKETCLHKMEIGCEILEAFLASQNIALPQRDIIE